MHSEQLANDYTRLRMTSTNDCTYPDEPVLGPGPFNQQTNVQGSALASAANQFHNFNNMYTTEQCS